MIHKIEYIFVVVFVTSLLLAIPLFPFWKLWLRLKNHHPDLWMSKGPFDVGAMLRNTDLVRGFLDVVALADHDDELLKRDPELIKWARVSREVWKMSPRTFGRQILYFCIFLYFVFFLTQELLSVLPGNASLR